MLTFIKTADGQFRVVADNVSYHFNRGHKNYQKLVEALMNDDVSTFVENYDTANKVAEWSEGSFVCKDGVLKYGEYEVPRELFERIECLIAEGFDHKPLLKFIERVYSNSSINVFKNLFKFMQHHGILINENGHIVAYKGVIERDGKYFDKHTGTIEQIVGQSVTMPRFLINEDPSVCSKEGLHVGSYSYARNWAPVLLICTVDPADVVSVPNDYSFQKMRTCKYTILKIGNEVEKQEDYAPKKEEVAVNNKSDEIVRLYKEEELSTRQIAERMSCAPSTVQRILAKAGVERRSYSEAKLISDLNKNAH